MKVNRRAQGGRASCNTVFISRPDADARLTYSSSIWLADWSRAMGHGARHCIVAASTKSQSPPHIVPQANSAAARTELPHLSDYPETGASCHQTAEQARDRSGDRLNKHIADWTGHLVANFQPTICGSLSGLARRLGCRGWVVRRISGELVIRNPTNATTSRIGSMMKIRKRTSCRLIRRHGPGHPTPKHETVR